MKGILTLLVLIAMLSPALAQQNRFKKIKLGNWHGDLHLTQKQALPLLLIASGSNKNYTLSVVNGEDTIELQAGTKAKDTLRFRFPDFNSELVLKRTNKTKLTGYWQNFNKGSNYKIPFTADYGYVSRFPVQHSLIDTANLPLVDGKWKVEFDYGKESAYFSIGNFMQSGNEVKGSFLTETGDYGHLEGNISNDSLYLSGFDGSKAYLFTSKIDGTNLVGDFRSGIHFYGQWKAERNDDFELSHPDSLTILVDDFHFSVHDLNKNTFNFPQEKYQDKVVIVQIMGTWCANCMDEMRLFKELYSQYNKKGLEIISVNYELGDNMEEWIAKTKRVQEKHNIQFDLLIGGSARGEDSDKDFSALNHVMSFPTSIFIDRNGNVRKIHTGFSGPGTGEYYTKFVQEINKFLQELLAED